MKFKNFGLDLKANNVILITIGNIILSFGLFNIHSFAEVTEGGVLGLMLFFEHWFKISPAVSGFVMNMSCYAFCAKVRGRNFIAYSVISGVVFSASYCVFEMMGAVYSNIAEYPLIASALGALFVGVGAGLCVRAGAATSGDDALAMAMSDILEKDIRIIYLISDLLVLALSLTYIPVTRIMYSLLTVIISGQIIGFIQNFGNEKMKKR